MFVVRDANNEIIAMCSQKSDADAFAAASTIDNEIYTVEDTLEEAIIEEYFLQVEDGVGEGQPR